MCAGQVVGPLITTRVTDDDVLVIGERPDVGFLGGQRLLAEVGRHADFRRVRIPRAAVAGGAIDIVDDLLDIDGLRPGGDSSVDENAIGVDGNLDTNQSILLLPHGGGNDRFGDGIGQSVGVSRGKETR
jgi:hypothetical protein